MRRRQQPLRSSTAQKREDYEREIARSQEWIDRHLDEPDIVAAHTRRRDYFRHLLEVLSRL